MTTKTIEIAGKSYEVVSSNKGWTKYYDDKGSIRSVRNAVAAKPAAKAKAAKPAAKAKSATKAKAAKKTDGEHLIGTTVVDLSKYSEHKLADGTRKFDIGDKAAKALRELTLDEQYKEVAKYVKEEFEVGTNAEAEAVLRKKYGKLNPGMQRMNLGNRYRAALRNV